MSEQSPFAPFETPVPGPPTQPQKRKNRTKMSPPASPTDQPFTDVVRGEDTVVVTRQKRKKTEAKPSLKFDLQTILRAAAGLNEDDLTTFEKIVGLLSEAGKPGRERLLAAIEKIFA
jgi:hypothetical protein